MMISVILDNSCFTDVWPNCFNKYVFNYLFDAINRKFMIDSWDWLRICQVFVLTGPKYHGSSPWRFLQRMHKMTAFVSGHILASFLQSGRKWLVSFILIYSQCTLHTKCTSDERKYTLRHLVKLIFMTIWFEMLSRRGSKYRKLRKYSQIVTLNTSKLKAV